MTAMHIYGLSENEMVYMIKAIAETGEELEFYRVSNKVTDISSLGGISDKIILMLISIMHSLGVTSAKVIGRELGMEDRLISIDGYKLEDDIESFNYMNSRFEKYLKALNQSEISEEELDKILSELHKSFASLTQEEQKYANIFVHDIQSGRKKEKEEKNVL